uniref:Zinc finger protein CONSTANS-LIKE 5 n=1 Tax=Noccaea caerulescens TaxID=107243 RepID=A0A1J3H3Y6_NOCCA
MIGPLHITKARRGPKLKVHNFPSGYVLQIPNSASLSLFFFLFILLKTYVHSLLCSIPISTSRNIIYNQEQEEMYAETGLAFHRFMQGCPPEIQQFEELFKSYKLSDEMNNLAEACEYGFGEESDLFKAPEPMIIEEPVLLAIDPLSQEIAELSDLESLQSDQQLIDKAFYDCEQDLLVKSAMESPLSEVLDIKNISLVTKLEDVMKSSTSSVVVSDVPVPKSVSSGNLSSMDMAQQHEDGMRRAFSESDIQTLGTRNAGLVQSHLDRIIVSCTSEDRREKLSRYRNKKSRRNFRHKVKYACRKALADSQPRIRGRFAKTEEMQK